MLPVPPPFWENPAFWLYVALALPFVLCLLFYGLRSPWRRSPVGRALFTLLASLVSVLVFVVVRLSGLITEPVTNVLRVVLLSGVMVAGWVLLANILRLQRNHNGAGEPHTHSRSTDPPGSTKE